ncbi:hypothetical protein ACFS27_13330 [Promicromonospora vindobonensis]|uniref:Uncharacterized protein n=1 Tax=Promicromonospora vindobonensis TaxID=195748 RepID=A0ABW5VS70_9MICO
MNTFGVVVVGHGAAAQAVLRELRANAPHLSAALIADAGGIIRTLVTKGVLTGLLSADQTAGHPPQGVERVEGPAAGPNASGGASTCTCFTLPTPGQPGWRSSARDWSVRRRLHL